MEVDSPYTGNTVSSPHCYIYKNIIGSGGFGRKPRDNSECIIKITDVSIEGMDVDLTSLPDSFSRYLKVQSTSAVHVGWGDTFVDKGLESCIQSMFLKEKSRFTLLFPKEISSVPIESPPEDPIVVKCTIFLDSFSQPYLIYEMSDAQLYEEALKHKNQGVELFKTGRTVDAFLRFSKAFKFFLFVNKAGENICADDVKHLGLSILNDLALCQFKFGHFHHVVEICAKALALDAGNEKSLYRRALAYIELKNYNDAEDDLNTLLKVKPHAQHVVDKYRELKTLTKEVDEKYAAVVKKMFS
ncbi:uncharacterized protein Bdbt [Anabrus simplex]|uniref:uncharacterized protein Bdbt n=1 Tax=Anabrus simplex TaxID=316456 RepID=UPI0035A2CC31